MQVSKQQTMQLFLDKNYITLPNLAKQCGINETKILELENSQCIPGHTYEARQITIFTCAGIDTALTENTAFTTNLYYHSSVVRWVNDALFALKHQSLLEVALMVKDNFAKQLDKALGGLQTPGCQNFDQAWGYWIDGTWGKCLKQISVDCLVKKELSRHYIAEIMKEDVTSIDKDTKIELTNAIKAYVEASLDFDIYGMRHVLAETAIEKFQLDISLDNRLKEEENKKY